MKKDELIEQMLKDKGDTNNSIDLDAYARGLIDMYDKLEREEPPSSDGIVKYYYLKDGDEVINGDEFFDCDYSESWEIVTGQETTYKYNTRDFYKMRRKI